MNTIFAIRQAAISDAPAIVTHRRRMFEDMGYNDVATLDTAAGEFLAWLLERMERGEYLGWLAISPSGEVAAGAGLWLQAWPPGALDRSPYRGYVLNVYTCPEYRRRGLAHQLVLAIIAWCEAQQIRVVYLHASDQGRSIYESLGFAATNEMRLIVTR